MKITSLMSSRWVSLVRQTVTEWVEDGALRLSAAMAYYSVFSIAPLLVIFISIAGLVLGPDAVRGQLDEQLSSYIGKQAAAGVQSMVQGAAKPAQGWIGTIVGFVVLLVGATGVFGQLKDALNIIWDVKVTRKSGVVGLLRERLLSFGMVLAIGFLLLVSLLLSTAIAALSKYLNSYLGVPAEAWTLASLLVSMVLLAVLFATIFKILPDIEVRWHEVWVGAGVTAVLFEAGKFGLGFYLGRESTASTYGAAASVVLLLLWVYYASCILLFGAEFTQVYARASGRDIRPAPNAELISEESSGKRPRTVDGKLARPQQSDAEEHVHAHAGFSTGRVVTAAAHEPGKALEPVAAFLGTMAISFAVGLTLRRMLEPDGRR
jgi:membrane protein